MKGTCDEQAHPADGDFPGWPRGVVSSRLERTGTFECSDAGLNQLYYNVIWSQRSNFISIPTDCPQRDERLGRTSDIMVFAPAACLNFDSEDFLASWLADLAVD